MLVVLLRVCVCVYLLMFGIFCLFLLSFLICVFFVLFFFFKQKTAYEMRISDWSSDVCSSDLGGTGVNVLAARREWPLAIAVTATAARCVEKFFGRSAPVAPPLPVPVFQLEQFHRNVDRAHREADFDRSEERRVGKESVSKCRYRGSP